VTGAIHSQPTERKNGRVTDMKTAAKEETRSQSVARGRYLVLDIGLLMGDWHENGS
jgi:hypothetical protein